MKINTQSEGNGIIKLVLTGRMDVQGALAIDTEFNEIAKSSDKVIVDLLGVDFLASLGMRTLIVSAKSIQSNGGRMVLLGPQPNVERALKTARDRYRYPNCFGDRCCSGAGELTRAARMAADHRWQRTFTGSIAEVVDTSEWIEHIAAEQGWPQDILFALQICVEELLTNILRHGGKSQPRIAVAIALFADRIELIVEDDGAPFDVASAAPHHIDTPLDEVQPGGLGVQLIHSFADRLRYEGAGLGNRVRAIFNLPAAANSLIGTGMSGPGTRSPPDTTSSDILRSDALAQVLAASPCKQLAAGDVLVSQGAFERRSLFPGSRRSQRFRREYSLRTRPARDTSGSKANW